MEINEGAITLQKCERCKKWHRISELCTNEDTKITECIQCYITWRMSLLEKKHYRTK